MVQFYASYNGVEDTAKHAKDDIVKEIAKAKRVQEKARQAERAAEETLKSEEKLIEAERKLKEEEDKPAQ
jgi:hypothetical protein